MPLFNFVNEWNGRYTTEFPYIDQNGKVSYQCVGLMRQWQTEGLGLPADSIPAAPTAAQIFRNFPESGNQYYTKVHNIWSDTNQFPSQGDIVFWGFYPFITGVAGHVSIVSYADGWRMVTFDQNWGSPNFCKYVNHDYRGVMGWLHPKTA